MRGLGLALVAVVAVGGLAAAQQYPTRARLSAAPTAVVSPATGPGSDTCTGNGCAIGPSGISTDGGIRVVGTGGIVAGGGLTTVAGGTPPGTDRVTTTLLCVNSGCSQGMSQASGLLASMATIDTTATFTAGPLVLGSTDSSGSPGAATINKPSGRSAIALGAATVTITNSQAAASSRIFISPLGRDATCLLPVVTTRAAGSFVVTTVGNCTADLSFDWLVIQ